jgi:hypothetical protein
VAHGIDHHQSQHGDDDHHDGQRAQRRRHPADRAELVARHLAQAFAVAARGEEQDGHVLHATAEHRAHQQPERARQVAELHRQGGADQRTGAGNGGKVMPEHHPAMGGNVVAAVVQSFGGRGAGLVDHVHPGLDPLGVKAVAQGVDAHGRRNDPQGVDRFIPLQRDSRQSEATDQRQQDAQQFGVHVLVTPVRRPNQRSIAIVHS